MDLTSGLRSPESFRLWTAISTIAAVLERKVWTDTDAPEPLRPNMYTILTGMPASGKGMSISTSRRLLAPIGGLRLAPDNPTKRTFLNELQAAAKANMNGFAPYSAMTALVPELSVLISKYEKDFVADLTHIYDNPEKYTAPRQTSDDVNIDQPTLNILAGATPDALGDIIPETAWGQGFTSRIVFVYGTTITTRRNVFRKNSDIDFTPLQKRLETFFNDLHGPFDWEEPAQIAWDSWFNDEEMEPVPTYGRLVNYVGRRNEHVMKLAMVSAVSAGHELTVTLDDFRRAQKWLFDVEEHMPDVFRAMAQRSDTQLLQDLHQYMYGKYSSVLPQNRRAIQEPEMWQFLEDKTPSDKIANLITSAEKIGYIRRGLNAGEWIPNALDFRENKP